MKEPTRAPAYAVIYHGLCDIARTRGYALAIHESLAADLDLIAVPWVEEAKPVEELVEALRAHCQACLDIASWDVNPQAKPHGRIAWNLYMGAGATVDLSVMPISTALGPA